MSAADAEFIPLCVPEIRGREWHYVKDCLDTGWVSSVGSYVERFEAEIAHYIGAKHGVATVNGTAALHVALQLAGVERDDEVLVSTLTFIAPANAIRYLGAWPVFIDADPDYWQMDAAKVAAYLQGDCSASDGVLRNRRTGRRVKAILPVHVLGHPVDLAPIVELARRFGLAVIEDATESLGASYREKRVGNAGDVACFSFNGNKLLTTGGGGMIVTNNDAWAARAKYLTTQAKDDPVEYVHGAIGYNYRLTNLQAAMGCAQLEQVDDYIAAKRRIAERYARALAGLRGISVMAEAPWAASVFWMFTILVDEKTCGLSSRALLEALAARKIQTRPLWQPLHQSAAHRGAIATPCETAERLHRDALSLPCSVGLSAAQQERVIAAVTELVAGAGASPARTRSVG
jgi:perosamine synthetase